jgi:hypothetical protein
LAELGLRPFDRRLIGILLDHEGGAVGLHEGAFREVHLVEEAFDARHERHLLRRDHRADEFGLRGDLRKLDGRGLYHRRRCGRLLLGERAGTGKQAGTRDR